MPQVQCLSCLSVSEVPSVSATTWDCACGGSSYLRRCAGCGMVSQVRTMQRRGQPWDCPWCREANTGFVPRNDPATATMADFSAALIDHGFSG